ncbi:hypothetical protein JCM8097_002130 [Rhodosporidiobolus ruineniae]
MPVISKGVFLSACFSSVGALLYGIDNGWWATVIGLQTFNEVFGSKITVGEDGTITHSLSAPEQSAGTSLNYVGIAIGCLLATPLGRRGGRRLGIFAMAVVSLIGVIIQITASVHGYRYWQLVVGKIINALGMGLAANVTPTYISELSPAKWRGAMINLYQAVQIVGVIIATACVYALSTHTGTIAWQLPIGLQFVAPAMLLAGIWFMPESPRWLIFQGRVDEGRAVLEFLHGSDPDYSAADEVAELQAAYEHEKSIQQASIWAIFKGSDRRRALISMGVMCLQQAQGSAYMNGYIVLFLMALGFTDVLRLVMSIYCLYFAAILFSFYLPDRFGRRPMLIWGAVFCSLMLFIVSATNTGYGDAEMPKAAQQGLLACIFLWYFVFGLVWSPLTWIVCAEIPSARARESTLSATTFSAFVTALIITLVTPYIQDEGYGNAGAKVGFIWAAFTGISVPFVYFFVPEMKGLSLEQIDILFDKGVSAPRFQEAAKGLRVDEEVGIAAVATPGSGSLKEDMHNDK